MTNEASEEYNVDELYEQLIPKEFREEIEEMKKLGWEKQHDYNKEYYEKNKEKRRKQNREWYHNNKEKSKEYNDIYRKENRERYNKYAREYYKNNKAKILAKQKKKRLIKDENCT